MLRPAEKPCPVFAKRNSQSAATRCTALRMRVGSTVRQPNSTPRNRPAWTRRPTGNAVRCSNCPDANYCIERLWRASPGARLDTQLNGW